MKSTVRACPECDDASISKLSKRRSYDDDGEPIMLPPYRCSACGTRFDEPVTRQPYTASALANQLMQMDPDDIGTPTGHRRATDGGDGDGDTDTDREADDGD